MSLKCKEAKASVEVLDQDLSKFASQDPEDFVTICNKLGDKAGPLLTRPNQLYFKNDTIPSFTPEGMERFLKDMSLAVVEIPKSIHTEDTLHTESQTQNVAAQKSGKGAKALRRSHNDLREWLHEQQGKVDDLTEKLREEQLELVDLLSQLICHFKEAADST